MYHYVIRLHAPHTTPAGDSRGVRGSARPVCGRIFRGRMRGGWLYCVVSACVWCILVFVEEEKGRRQRMKLIANEAMMQHQEIEVEVDGVSSSASNPHNADTPR